MSQCPPDSEEYRYARDLLVSFVNEHCDPVPEWKPNDDLIGILMQFDNALAVVRSIKAGCDPKRSPDAAATPMAHQEDIYKAWAEGYAAGASGAAQAAPDPHQIAEIIGRHLAVAISGNNQPHMSGDPRNRLVGIRRRYFDDACQSAAEAILALSSTEDKS